MSIFPSFPTIFIAEWKKADRESADIWPAQPLGLEYGRESQGWVNGWYGETYYSVSPANNSPGPVGRHP